MKSLLDFSFFDMNWDILICFKSLDRNVVSITSHKIKIVSTGTVGKNYHEKAGWKKTKRGKIVSKFGSKGKPMKKRSNLIDFKGNFFKLNHENT